MAILHKRAWHCSTVAPCTGGEAPGLAREPRLGHRPSIQPSIFRPTIPTSHSQFHHFLYRLIAPNCTKLHQVAPKSFCCRPIVCLLTIVATGLLFFLSPAAAQPATPAST